MKDIYWAEAGTGTGDAGVNDNAKDDSNDVVETSNNRIYFYSEVTRPKILSLNKALTNLNTNLINQANSLQTDPASIHLHINSFGGSVFAGLAATDYIINSKVPVHTIVEGAVASAATLFSVVGHHRVMRKNSFMLIHQISSGMWGKYEEMKDGMQNNDLFMDIIRQIYHQHTKIPKRKLREIMKRDLWFDAETCLDYGMIDEIV